MQKFLLFGLLFVILACKDATTHRDATSTKSRPHDSITEHNSKDMKDGDPPKLTLKSANKLAKLPLDCMQTEFPNKMDHVMGSQEAVSNPGDLHPAFYGCFDWHSSVHGHWSLVRLLKLFPDLDKADEIRKKLKQNISKNNIEKEVDYFTSADNKNAERTYGWAWLLKLAEELKTWDDPMADSLETNLEPLTRVIVDHFKEFLPKLTNPLRVGEHANTAFGLVFAYDYADTFADEDLKKVVVRKAKDFYQDDEDCPIGYEPGGTDFLSPCLEEVNIMERVLSDEEFEDWLTNFMPGLMEEDFDLNPGKVTDREDGKLVHLDGLNFSRAWVFYDLANTYDNFSHLKKLGDKHFKSSFSDIIQDDSYMGSHWLGSFALYALDRRG